MGFPTRGDAMSYVVGSDFFGDKEKNEGGHVGSYWSLMWALFYFIDPLIVWACCILGPRAWICGPCILTTSESCFKFSAVKFVISNPSLIETQGE